LNALLARQIVGRKGRLGGFRFDVTSLGNSYKLGGISHAFHFHRVFLGVIAFACELMFACCSTY
jgi:hypothetical protein